MTFSSSVAAGFSRHKAVDALRDESMKKRGVATLERGGFEAQLTILQKDGGADEVDFEVCE
jgi:hypothetical protein